jgi:putative membrane protein
MDDGRDPRFSLANERTFLAWIRTALGFLASGAGVVAIDLPWPDAAVRALAVLLTAAAAVSALLGWWRWRAVEAAIAEGRAAPPMSGQLALSLVVGFVAAVVTVLIVF